MIICQAVLRAEMSEHCKISRTCQCSRFREFVSNEERLDCEISEIIVVVDVTYY